LLQDLRPVLADDGTTKLANSCKQRAVDYAETLQSQKASA
jgi:hypothetical protein